MSYSKFAQEYQKNSVSAASPLQLIVMLYDGALKHMEAGKHAMSKGQLQAQNESLQKAQRIILELLSCLDMDKGGEIAKNLFGLYTYAVNELVEANVKDQPEGIDRAMLVLSDLRKSWQELESSTRQSPPSEDRLAA